MQTVTFNRHRGGETQIMLLSAHSTADNENLTTDADLHASFTSGTNSVE